MEFWIEICLIIIAAIFFCLFFRWVIIEWKNRLLLGGYFKHNADILREVARQQSRARREAAAERRRADLAPRNLFVHIPPPEFDVALKMNKVFYIDVEEAPPTYDFAVRKESQIVETHKCHQTSLNKRDAIAVTLIADSIPGKEESCKNPHHPIDYRSDAKRTSLGSSPNKDHPSPK